MRDPRRAEMLSLGHIIFALELVARNGSRDFERVAGHGMLERARSSRVPRAVAAEAEEPRPEARVVLRSEQSNHREHQNRRAGKKPGMRKVWMNRQNL